MKTKNSEILLGTPVIQADDASSLCTQLEDAIKSKAITGYILKTPSYAVVNLEESETSMYSIFMIQALDSAEKLVSVFGMGATEGVTVEGKKAKAVCKILGEIMVCVFGHDAAAVEEVFRASLVSASN